MQHCFEAQQPRLSGIAMSGTEKPCRAWEYHHGQDDQRILRLRGDILSVFATASAHSLYDEDQSLMALYCQRMARERAHGATAERRDAVEVL